MRLDIDIHELAAGQHALIATWQLRALGANHDEVLDLGRSVDWERVTRRVLARTAVPWTEERHLMAAVLDASPGAAIADVTAAAMWGAPGYPSRPIHVVRHRGISRRTSPLAVAHEVVDLWPHHVKIKDGIPVISPARVVCELAAHQHPARVARTLDWFWSNRLLDGATFRRTVRELAGRGRKGSPIMRQLDACRGPGYVPPASGVEGRVAEILRNAGEAPLRRQIDSGSDEEWCGRVDFRDDQLPLIVEVQSALHHSSLVDQADDAARRKALEDAGYTVLEVWDSDVFHEPRSVVERVRSARCDLRSRGSA
jgi:hypothetical protein